MDTETINENGKCPLDEHISKVLLDVIDRPLFINLQHGGKDISSLVTPDQYSLKGEIELVGSSTDGLKTARCYDVGDLDMLVYANVTLSADDEATFEYRKDNPSWCHIPLPRSLDKLKPVDGRYLNASVVRSRDEAIFQTVDEHFYKDAAYTILFLSVEKSDYKCAETSAVQWSDPVFHDDLKAPDHFIPQSLYFIWVIEHVLFTFLLNRRVGKTLEFVRGLLYGVTEEQEKEMEMDLRSKLKLLFALLKEDIQRVTINQSDIIYFRNEPFTSMLKQAVDFTPKRNAVIHPHGEYSNDIVPAIRCEAWPKPASCFITRRRLWPSKTVIEEIVKEGFKVVPKAAILDPNTEKDFIISFSHTEVKLIRLLPQSARTAYCLLKMCYKSCEMSLKKGNKMKTYHLKQALLWVAEGRLSNSWDVAGPLQSIRWICEFLIKVLRQNYFPSFFVEESNHIYHFTDEDCERHIELFVEIHRNPANYIKVVIDQEWEFSEATMPSDSFHQIQEPGYFSSFTSKELLKIYMNAYASIDGYQIDKLCEMKELSEHERLCQQFADESFSSEPLGSTTFTLDVTESQLMHVDTFVQTVTKLNMDLFNVLDQLLDTDILTHELQLIPEEVMKKYPQIQQDSSEEFGEHLFMMLRLRLKYYGNIFHVVCNKLYFATFLGSSETVRNQDAKYIIRFLKELVVKRNFDQDNVLDLLHYLFYFCHFTRLRHHKLNVTDQIIRSIREFLQDARVLMTVYFNPKLIMPRPVDTGDRTRTVLDECFPSRVRSDPKTCQRPAED